MKIFITNNKIFKTYNKIVITSIVKIIIKMNHKILFLEKIKQNQINLFILNQI